MNIKPKPIRWLEEQTGQTIAYPDGAAADTAPHDRHLSVRLPNELALALEALAAEREVKVSHLVRDFLTDAVEQRGSVAALAPGPWPIACRGGRRRGPPAAHRLTARGDPGDPAPLDTRRDRRDAARARRPAAAVPFLIP